MVDENGAKRTRDYGFAFELVNEKKVVSIPVSPFYCPNEKHLGEKYVRFAFCKPESMIKEAARRWNN